MSSTEIKSELQKMIQQETDIKVLEAIRTLLIKTSLDPIVKEKLSNRALKSEQDIEAGNVFTKEEVIQRTQRK